MATLNEMIATWMAPAPRKLKLYWLRKFGVLVPRALESRMLDIWAQHNYRQQPTFDGPNNVILCGSRRYLLSVPCWHTLPNDVIVKIGLFLTWGWHWRNKYVHSTATVVIPTEQYENLNATCLEWLVAFRRMTREDRLPIVHLLLNGIKKDYREALLRNVRYFSPTALRTRQDVRDRLTRHYKSFPITETHMTMYRRALYFDTFTPEYIPRCKTSKGYTGHIFRLRVANVSFTLDLPVSRTMLLRANLEQRKATVWNKYILIRGNERFSPRTTREVQGGIQAPMFWPHEHFFAGTNQINKRWRHYAFTGRAQFDRVWKYEVKDMSGDRTTEQLVWLNSSVVKRLVDSPYYGTQNRVSVLPDGMKQHQVTRTAGAEKLETIFAELFTTEGKQRYTD